jgi:NAD(P)-dependent dehydrogenase (short-subunit alcohol dehydrogenase family)
MSKTWLITGSARGLGRHITEAALAAGDRVVATARRPEQLADLREQHGENVHPWRLDVTDYAAVQEAVQAAVDTYGSLDVVVNNAGYADLSALEDTTIERFQAQIDTNLMGVVYMTKAAVPVMREQGSGHIIQVSSVGGRLASPGLSAYQAAKWAVGGFTEVVAAETAPLGIKLTVLEPGGMTTEWGSASMDIPPISEPYQATVGARAATMDPNMEWATGDPRKVAAVVVAIAGDAEPPLRLLLGGQTYDLAKAASQRRAEEDARWEATSRSTDREPSAA